MQGTAVTLAQQQNYQHGSLSCRVTVVSNAPTRHNGHRRKTGTENTFSYGKPARVTGCPEIENVWGGTTAAVKAGTVTLAPLTVAFSLAGPT